MKKVLCTLGGMIVLRIFNDECVTLAALSIVLVIACCLLLKGAAERN